MLGLSTNKTEVQIPGNRNGNVMSLKGTVENMGGGGQRAPCWHVGSEDLEGLVSFLWRLLYSLNGGVK